MSNAEQLKDIQLPDGFGFFVKWLVERDDLDIDHIRSLLEKPWKYQEEWERYHTEVVEPEEKAALDEAMRRLRRKAQSNPCAFIKILEESDA